MRIICDMDGVLVDFINPLLEDYNRMYKENLKPEDIAEWSLPEEMVEIFMNDPNFFMRLRLYKGAEEMLARLRDSDHEIILATSPSQNPNIAAQKVQWVKDNLHLPEYCKNLALVERKDILQGDVIIDDNPAFFRGFDGVTLLVDQPWNRENIDYDFRVWSIQSIPTIIEFIEWRGATWQSA